MRDFNNFRAFWLEFGAVVEMQIQNKEATTKQELYFRSRGGCSLGFGVIAPYVSGWLYFRFRGPLKSNDVLVISIEIHAIYRLPLKSYDLRCFPLKLISCLWFVSIPKELGGKGAAWKSTLLVLLVIWVMHQQGSVCGQSTNRLCISHSLHCPTMILHQISTRVVFFTEQLIFSIEGLFFFIFASVTPILIAYTAKAKHAKSIKNMGLNVLSNRQNGAAQHEGIPAFRPALIACRKVKMMVGRKSMDSKEH